ncbi:hypothetical protein LPB140_10175 [Sphingorhabdus lutea]|uniref:DUF4105 domain-containing protein n=2 Tax=Sphingorhabdus lutea TaxID=1913578 RepID=A0A1L3JD90_9SPHN|nr:hypothetical protein LPB140_10175 [Sphingorhabdus lutea]
MYIFSRLTCIFIIFFSSVNIARAEVIATFYSHEFGQNFPHAFVILQGKVDSTGEIVDQDYGFTAKNLTPAILWKSVKGKVESQSEKYIAKSDARFSVRLNDAQYAIFMEKIAEWRDRGGNSYNLNKSNCIHFVADLITLSGLHINPESKFYKKPKSFLLEVMSLNEGLALIEPPILIEENGETPKATPIEGAVNAAS